MLTGCQLVRFIPLISKSFLALQLHLYQSVRPVYLGHFVPLMQKLETGMADLVCLDGRRITSKGITSGSNSFRVTAWQRLHAVLALQPKQKQPTLMDCSSRYGIRFFTAVLQCVDDCNETIPVHTHDNTGSKHSTMGRLCQFT